MEQQRGAYAHGRTADGGDHGLGKARDVAQEAPYGPVGRRLGRGAAGRLLEEVADVVARAENGFIALNHHHPNGRIAGGRLHGISHGRVHVGGDGVLAGQAVEADGAHTGFGVNEDV